VDPAYCRVRLQGRKRKKEMKTAMTIVTILALTTLLGCQISPQSESTSGKMLSESFHLIAAVDFPATEPVADSNATTADPNGPTVHLSYGTEALQGNPICSFMYFIPLISPVAVRCDTGANDDQRAGIISYTKQVTAKSFCMKCEFEMVGAGFSRYTFEPAGMIALRSADVKPGELLAHMLDYIRFEGAGFGSVQVRGTMDGATPCITEVSVEFNGRGRESPVTIGLYDLRARNGQYDYANRSNEMVARVNELTFKRGDDPRMGICVASICKKTQRAGLFGWFRATVANLFIKPVRVDKRGNNTMLDFGQALLKQETVFTFPKARNLKEATMVAATPGQE
jgi:hypothetical protein